MNRVCLMLLGGIVTFYLSSARARVVVLAAEPTKKDTTQEIKRQPEVEKDEDTNKDPAKDQSRAQALADYFKVSLSLITDLRQKKLGWGELAKKYELKLGLINREVHAVKREFKKVEHPGKPEQLGRPADRPHKQERTERQERIRPAETNNERVERPELFERSNRPEKVDRER